MPIFKNELLNVFEVSGVPSFNEFYNVGMYPWKLVYKGYVPEWHDAPDKSIAHPDGKRKRYRINTAKAVCSEMANLVWAEGSSVSVNQSGWDSEDKDPLQAYIDSILEYNNFDTKMRQLIEESMALGGATVRTYVDGKRDEKGNIVSGTECIKLVFGMADKFIPLSWDNTRVTEGVFIEKRASKGWYWTRLEFHKWNGEEYVVSNEYYKTDRPPVGNTSQDILGVRSPFSELWAGLADAVPFRNLQLGLFTYFRTCMANNLDDNSPLGISLYANCMDTLKALDVAFDSLAMEMILGKKRIIVPASAVRSVRDSKGFEHRYFDANDSVYEALYTDSAEQLKIQDNTVELRIDEHVRAINALLNILSMQIGLSEGALSFDSAKGMKTATEVISENSKTYRTVKLMQKPIQKSIEDLITEIIDISCAYDVSFAYEGREYNVYDLVKNGYNVVVSFDDSIIQDRDAEKAQGLRDVQNGLLSKRSYMIKYMGMTPEDADAELAMIQEEAKSGAMARTLNIDWDNVGV